MTAEFGYFAFKTPLRGNHRLNLLFLAKRKSTRHRCLLQKIEKVDIWSYWPVKPIASFFALHLTPIRQSYFWWSYSVRFTYKCRLYDVITVQRRKQIVLPINVDEISTQICNVKRKKISFSIFFNKHRVQSIVNPSEKIEKLHSHVYDKISTSIRLF